MQATKPDIPSLTLDSYPSLMRSTNGAICEKLNKKAMTENYAVEALNEEFHSKDLDNKRSLRGNQLLPSILGEVNTITGARKISRNVY